MSSDQVATGGCFCEQIRFRATGDATWVSYCHCRGCRKLTGAAFTVYVCYPDTQVELVEDSPRVFEPSPGIRQSFCGRCGTSIWYEDDTLPGDVYFAIGVFDAPEQYVPESHGNVAEMLEWLRISDNLPRHHLTARPRPKT